MQILKNKYMKNLIVLVIFLFFIGEGLETYSEGNIALAIIEIAAAFAAVLLVIVKRRKDKKNKAETEE